MNKDFRDDVIHELPIPKLISGLPRMVKMFYPADTSFYYDIEYEFIQNNIVHKKDAKIAVQVFSAYPTLSDSLRHEDKFRIAFRENLRANYQFGDSLFSLDIRDRLPWENEHVNIHMVSPSGIKKTINLKDKFQIKQGNFYHSFDSLDVLHKKILLATHEKPDTFKLVAKAFDSANSSIDYKDLPKAKGYRLVHFWGPWCVGCIKNMPRIKDFQQSYKTIEFIGVCADKDKSKCISSIEKLGITWGNVFVDLPNFDKKDQMNITVWPTYFIIDSEDVVRLRTSEIEELERFLKNN
jgi:thiol-disulfide isomerase/thioredoxin